MNNIVQDWLTNKEEVILALKDLWVETQIVQQMIKDMWIYTKRVAEELQFSPESTKKDLKILAHKYNVKYWVETPAFVCKRTQEVIQRCIMNSDWTLHCEDCEWSLYSI